SLGGSPGGGSPFGLTPGGGALRMTVIGPLILDGKISASGAAVPVNTNIGGASGGSLWLTVGGLSGAGSMTADGGAGSSLSGGGGGGRVAVYYTSNTFTGTFSAKGGPGFVNGG